MLEGILFYSIYNSFISEYSSYLSAGGSLSVTTTAWISTLICFTVFICYICACFIKNERPVVFIRGQEEEIKSYTKKKNDEGYITLGQYMKEEDEKNNQARNSEPFVAYGTTMAMKVSKIDDGTISLLKQYKELLDSGIITQEEFDIKKREIL
ncbi:MAG: SHOCT domain-containing protein [Clostridia bacterium]|nr:SHOCT domain-containing protein [Clostridia bacterium]